MTHDWTLWILDRLHEAYDRAECSDMKAMWLHKIREYQHKQNFWREENDKVHNGNSVILPDNGTGVVLLRGNGGLK
jgi:hypothetical protein